MAFSDLCHIGNAYKTVENETDQSERIMEENSMVRDLITKILDDTGPTEGCSSIQPSEKVLSLQNNNAQYRKTETGNASFIPPSTYNYQNNSLYNFAGQNDRNGFNFNLPNGFGNSNGFVNYPDNDVNALLGIDPVADATTETVTPEQLNLLRLAAQEIGGAQFSSPNKFDDKYYNFFESNQRNSLPESNMFSVNNFNRPNSLNLEMNFNNFENTYNSQRYPNKFDYNVKDQNQDQEILAYLNQLNMSLDRNREENVNNLDFKMPMDLNGHYPNEEFNKVPEGNKMFFNRNFPQMPPNKNFADNNFYDVMGQMNERSPMNQNFDFANQSTPVSAANSMNYKPNGFHPQNEFMHRREMNQIIPRENFQGNASMGEQRTNFDNSVGRDGMQQAALMRQNQELARQMSLLMRNRPPPNQLNVDVSFLHENAPFNLGIGALLGPSPSVPPPVLPSPMLDLPLLAPFYAMRNMRGAATSSSILHARLDACYEQWRQLERERKRTEARLALAYPGRAVSSSNSIPVPRLPPCPTRVDRLTVDMLREHTKVLTLMGKMETLRASVCVAQNKKPNNKSDDPKITVLKRGQENVSNEKDKESVDPSTFDPTTWRDDVRNLSEIAPHSEVESAMLAWRSAVAAVQAARRRELAPQHARYQRNDPILQLAEAVKQLCVCARRARCAMWCDLTLTVALAPPHTPPAVITTAHPTAVDNSQFSEKSILKTEPVQEKSEAKSIQTVSKPHSDTKDEKPSSENQIKNDTKTENTNNSNKATTNSKQLDKQTDKTQQRRPQNYRKINQRNDFYQKNQRYDNRFMHNRHPYHYLATGPIN